MELNIQHIVWIKQSLGVTENHPYSVSVKDAIKDVGLWRRVINGYPYKTCEELGVANKLEAFTATKQAIYCYIHGNNVNDYGSIGEAGKRTLSALRKIVSDAENSKETQIANTVSIKRVENKWQQDKENKNYVYKTFYITANSSIEKYKISLSKLNSKDLGGIKIVNEKGEEKQEFEANEKFKILIPIKIMNEKGTIKIDVKTNLKTKPVLYGLSPDSNYQDYALATATYEDATGTINDEYQRNETKIIVKKQDEATKKGLEAVEFQLLDQNKKATYSALKTNKDGKITINNMVPGTYYLKETKTIDGYEIYEDLIKIEIGLNEEVTVIVNNKKEEKPEIEKTKNQKEVSQTSVKKLPVTGM